MRKGWGAEKIWHLDATSYRFVLLKKMKEKERQKHLLLGSLVRSEKRAQLLHHRVSSGIIH
jgi:hypothetical protein